MWMYQCPSSTVLVSVPSLVVKSVTPGTRGCPETLGKYQDNLISGGMPGGGLD